MMRIQELKELQKANGLHFFDKSTMEFFGSKIELFDICSEFFVTSEKRPHSDDKRRFTLRRFSRLTGAVSTVGEFQGYKTKAAAWKARLEEQV